MVLKIGDVVLVNRVVAAPMAGVTDRAYRTLAREAGCALVFTGMMSDRSLVYGGNQLERVLDCEGEEGPLAVQIFGNDPGYMARAAEIAVSWGADIIDINMGCPAPKIVRGGAGVALMRDPPLAGRIIRAVTAAVSRPVTVKMRKGWDESSVNAVEMAKVAEEAGAKAVTVHGRTRSQFYGGEADWEIIGRVKDAVSVPVIGNGDIRGPEDAARMLLTTGCDAVMVGRASLGNPWLFRQIAHYLATGEKLPPPGPEEKVQIALRHLELLVREKGERVALLEMRKHAAWYTRGLRGAARLRERINRAGSLAELKTILFELL